MNKWIWYFLNSISTIKKAGEWLKFQDSSRVILLLVHLKFCNTSSIGIPVRSLLQGRQTSNWSFYYSTNWKTARWYSNKTSFPVIINYASVT